MAEKPARDFSHIHFPDVHAVHASRDALRRKLSEIQSTFDELDRRRRAQAQPQPQQAQQAGQAQQDQPTEKPPPPPVAEPPPQ